LRWCCGTPAYPKTLQQLAGLFGVWEDFLAKEVHNCGLDEIHDMLKAKYLARIYVKEPMNQMQEWWVDLCALYQETGRIDKLEEHAKEISLGWATKEQVREFMDAVEAEYQSIGHPLPVLDPMWRQREEYWREW